LSGNYKYRTQTYEILELSYEFPIQKLDMNRLLKSHLLQGKSEVSKLGDP